MKRIHNYFAKSRVHRSAGSFLLPLFLLTLTSFFGTVPFVSAQTTPEVCRELKKVIDQYERELDELRNIGYFKNYEPRMRQNLSDLNKAIQSGALLSTQNLKDTALDLRMELPKEAGRMTPEERSAFQRKARAFLVQKIDEYSGITVEEFRQRADRINQQRDSRWDRYSALKCSDVLEGLTPDVIKECDVDKGSVCGTWTRMIRDNKNVFEAVWDNGAKATLTIEQFDSDGVIITRNDPAGVTKGLAATYKGKLSGNSIVNGKVEWKYNGKTWSGTWTASW